MNRPKQHVSWADNGQSGADGFLAFRGKEPARPTLPSPFRAPAIIQGTDDRGPSALHQDLKPKLNPPRPTKAPSQALAKKSTAGTMRLGRKTVDIISTLQAPRPGQEAMSHGVYRVEHPEKGQLVVKRLSMTSVEKAKRAVVEVSALERVQAAVKRHENINNVVTIFWSNQDPLADLVLEYCDNGSLADGIDYMRKDGSRIAEDFAFHLFYGIAKGLAMLHHGIPDHTDHSTKVKPWETTCLLDIKPANVLLSLQQFPGRGHMRHPRVVLADFGCSITRDDIQSGRESKTVQEHGTPGWFPPENGHPEVGRYGKPTDIWQCGGVIQAMCLLLFQPDMNRLSLPCAKRYGAELNCLVAACLSERFEKRPTAVSLCDEIRKVMISKGFQV